MITRDITGIKFNMLLAIKDVGRTKQGVHLWIFKCECGREVQMRKPQVTSGQTKSCGCLQRISVSLAATNHGLCKHPLFKIWLGMKSRCYYKNNPQYHIYGAIGVTVCKEWKDNFKPFYDWCLENGWEKGLQIDKDILSKKLNIVPAIYSPKTCCILTPRVNSNNTKRNKYIDRNGEIKTLAEWGVITGIPSNTINYRLMYGWDVESALTIPTTKTGKRKCLA